MYPDYSAMPEPIDARFQSCDVVQIYRAPGWSRGNASLVRATCSLQPSTACVRDSDCSARSEGLCTGSSGVGEEVCESSGVRDHGAVKCFHKETFEASDVGRYVVRCFEARDPQGDKMWTAPKNDASFPYDARFDALEGLCSSPNKACSQNGYSPDGSRYPPNMVQKDRFTCSSPPLCLRIYVEGTPPAFASPTPVEDNSYDDAGVLVPGRTDIGACEGYPLQLTLSASDADATDLVRIYLEDPYVTLDNVDFFLNVSASATPLACAGTVVGSSNPLWGGFAGYGAGKVGDNALQASDSALAAPKAVVSPYLPAVQYTKTPRLSVAFTLDTRKRNGIVVRNADPFMQVDPSGQNCMLGLLGFSNMTSSGGSCRQKLVNMDQTVCAHAIDNSRLVWGRWVGQRNPNGAQGARDHSNGDVASRRRCWRIRMQAPPVFVTGPDKKASPFADAWSIAVEDGTLITGKTAAYPQVPAVAGVEIQRIFYFADPNAEDSVQLFVIGDPAPPRGLTLSATQCIPMQVS